MENDEFDLIKYNKNYMIFEIGGNISKRRWFSN